MKGLIFESTTSHFPSIVQGFSFITLFFCFMLTIYLECLFSKGKAEVEWKATNHAEIMCPWRRENAISTYHVKMAKRKQNRKSKEIHRKHRKLIQ